MTDPFANTQPSLSGPASSGFAVTPNDATDFPQPTRALYIGNGGQVSVQMLTGEALTLSAVPGGSLLPIRVRRVLATGTTATAIAALY